MRNSRLGVRRWLVGEGQVERKRASLARFAFDPDFPAQQARELAADGKPQSRAAVFAAGGSVSLLEGFENDFPLAFRDSHPRLPHAKPHPPFPPTHFRL